MHRFFFAGAVVIGLFVAAPFAQAESFKALFPDIYPQINDTYLPGVDAMDLLQGKVPLSGGVAEVDVPANYYFIGPKDSRFVLEQVWGNPEDTSILGMIFPRDGNAFDGAWGVIITYEESGYVSDAEAAEMDYDALLASMQADNTAVNEERKKAGYPAVHILGWAATPHYDAQERKLFWAKSLHFDGETNDTLNYNIRALGRKGVLVVNFVATSDQLASVETATPDVLKMVSFTTGNRYTDYLPDVDKVAAYGIGGLIAGGIASKTGMLVVVLALLKKGFVFLLLPIAWVWRKITGAKDSKPDQNV
jgi:uncharacterized membrane-anchored protein